MSALSRFAGWMFAGAGVFIIYTIIRANPESPRSRYIEEYRRAQAEQQARQNAERTARIQDSMLVLGLLAQGDNLADDELARAEVTLHDRAFSLPHAALHQRYADLVLDSATSLLRDGHQYAGNAESLAHRALAGPLTAVQQDAWIQVQAGVQAAARDRAEAARLAVPADRRARREFEEEFERMLLRDASVSLRVLTSVYLSGYDEDVLHVEVPGDAAKVVLALIARDAEMLDAMRVLGFTEIEVKDGTGSRERLYLDRAGDRSFR